MFSKKKISNFDKKSMYKIEGGRGGVQNVLSVTLPRFLVHDYSIKIIYVSQNTVLQLCGQKLPVITELQFHKKIC